MNLPGVRQEAIIGIAKESHPIHSGRQTRNPNGIHLIFGYHRAQTG